MAQWVALVENRPSNNVELVSIDMNSLDEVRKVKLFEYFYRWYMREENFSKVVRLTKLQHDKGFKICSLCCAKVPQRKLTRHHHRHHHDDEPDGLGNKLNLRVWPINQKFHRVIPFTFNLEDPENLPAALTAFVNQNLRNKAQKSFLTRQQELLQLQSLASVSSDISFVNRLRVQKHRLKKASKLQCQRIKLQKEVPSNYLLQNLNLLQKKFGEQEEEQEEEPEGEQEEYHEDVDAQPHQYASDVQVDEAKNESISGQIPNNSSTERLFSSKNDEGNQYQDIIRKVYPEYTGLEQNESVVCYTGSVSQQTVERQLLLERQAKLQLSEEQSKPPPLPVISASSTYKVETHPDEQVNSQGKFVLTPSVKIGNDDESKVSVSMASVMPAVPQKTEVESQIKTEHHTVKEQDDENTMRSKLIDGFKKLKVELTDKYQRNLKRITYVIPPYQSPPTRLSQRGEVEMTIEEFDDLMEESLSKHLTLEEREEPEVKFVAKKIRRRLFVTREEAETESEYFRSSKEEADDPRLPPDHYFNKNKQSKRRGDPVVTENEKLKQTRSHAPIRSCLRSGKTFKFGENAKLPKKPSPQIKKKSSSRAKKNKCSTSQEVEEPVIATINLVNMNLQQDLKQQVNTATEEVTQVNVEVQKEVGGDLPAKDKDLVSQKEVDSNTNQGPCDDFLTLQHEEQPPTSDKCFENLEELNQYLSCNSAATEEYLQNLTTKLMEEIQLGPTGNKKDLRKLAYQYLAMQHEFQRTAIYIQNLSEEAKKQQTPQLDQLINLQLEKIRKVDERFDEARKKWRLEKSPNQSKDYKDPFDDFLKKYNNVQYASPKVEYSPCFGTQTPSSQIQQTDQVQGNRKLPPCLQSEDTPQENHTVHSEADFQNQTPGVIEEPPPEQKSADEQTNAIPCSPQPQIVSEFNPTFKKAVLDDNDYEAEMNEGQDKYLARIEEQVQVQLSQKKEQEIRKKIVVINTQSYDSNEHDEDFEVATKGKKNMKKRNQKLQEKKIEKFKKIEAQEKQALKGILKSKQTKKIDSIEEVTPTPQQVSKDNIDFQKGNEIKQRASSRQQALAQNKVVQSTFKKKKTSLKEQALQKFLNSLEDPPEVIPLPPPKKPKYTKGGAIEIQERESLNDRVRRFNNQRLKEDNDRKEIEEYNRKFEQKEKE